MKIEECYDILKSPVISEKSTTLSQFNKYVFLVEMTATKAKVREAVEKIFSVKVVKVSAINVAGKTKMFRGKRGVQSDYKKMIVTVEQGKTIDLNVEIK